MELTDIQHGDRNKNKIALTFDDGPNPFWTLKILDVLDKYEIKATFFVLGNWAEKYPEIVQETFKRGHTIGNHSYSHPKEGRGDFEQCEQIIFNIIGECTKFIRPPHNNTPICYAYEPIKNEGVKIVNNDVIPKDWLNKAEEIYQITLNETKKGSIILLHDGSQRETEIENRPSEMFKVLPQIIEKLKEEYEFVKLEELLET